MESTCTSSAVTCQTGRAKKGPSNKRVPPLLRRRIFLYLFPTFPLRMSLWFLRTWTATWNRLRTTSLLDPALNNARRNSLRFRVFDSIDIAFYLSRQKITLAKVWVCIYIYISYEIIVIKHIRDTYLLDTSYRVVARATSKHYSWNLLSPEVAFYYVRPSIEKSFDCSSRKLHFDVIHASCARRSLFVLKEQTFLIY